MAQLGLVALPQLPSRLCERSGYLAMGPQIALRLGNDWTWVKGWRSPGDFGKQYMTPRCGRMVTKVV